MKKRQEYRERAMQKRKCFGYEELGHIARNYRKKNIEMATHLPSNKLIK